MGTNEIKIGSGERREFFTGAESQASSGKGTPVLVPGDAIIDIAKHFEKGAAIYGARNWEKGIHLSEQLNSLERHLQQEKMGVTDEPHARALAWRAVCYLATKLRIENGLLPAGLDDMPVYTTLEERLDKVDITKTIEEILVVNDELAEEFGDEPGLGEEWSSVDLKGDGKNYCRASACFKRGFPSVKDGDYYCREHENERETNENLPIT